MVHESLYRQRIKGIISKRGKTILKNKKLRGPFRPTLFRQSAGRTIKTGNYYSMRRLRDGKGKNYVTPVPNTSPNICKV